MYNEKNILYKNEMNINGVKICSVWLGARLELTCLSPVPSPQSRSRALL